MKKVIADFLPAVWRKAVYVTLAAATGLEAIWDIVPDPLEGKILASATVLGFGIAFTQTNDPPPPEA